MQQQRGVKVSYCNISVKNKKIHKIVVVVL